MDVKYPYLVERCYTLEQLNDLQKEWADLIAVIPDAPIFLTWEWIRTWWISFGKGRELWLLTARDKQGCLLGIAPLMREFQRAGPVKFRIIKFIGVGLTHPLHLNFLIHPSNQVGLLQAFLEFLLDQSSQWDVIRLAAVVKESGLLNLFTTAGGRIRSGFKSINVYVPLPGDWETYVKTLSKKLRRNLKYFQKKLEDDYPGSVAFSCISDPLELPDAMQKLEEFSKNRLNSKKRISNFAYTNFSAFHEAFARVALDRRWLRLTQFTVSGRVIAISYNFFFHNRVYAQAIGFDSDWSGYSPGRLTIAHCIQSAVQEGATEYDWLWGEEVYKLAWTDQVRAEDDILFSKNWLGVLWIEWITAQDVLIRELIALARQWLPQSTRAQINHLFSRHHKITEDRDSKDAK